MENNKSFTAVEWLENQIKNSKYFYKLIEDIKSRSTIAQSTIFEQAKQMEKEQIIDAFWNGDNTNCIAEQNAKEFAEKYYNKTFKKD
tara:strand:- start:2046 stop:2306 length:261 start_codon:yes stop_codon:yes gene_type:complete